MGNYDEWIRLRTQCAERGDWQEAKLLNRLIMEEDLRNHAEHVNYYPPRLQIEHSNVCNAKCIMCSHYFTENKNARFADETLKAQIRPLLPYVEKITLHGVGEPLAHPDIAEFIEWYHSYGIRVACNTNMAYMNERLAKAIHHAFTGISISCDGCTKETYEGIRQGLKFETFLENVRMLRSYGEKLQIRMHTVAMRQNLEELPGLVRLASELGCCHITIVDMTSQEFLENRRDEPRHYTHTIRRCLGEAVRAAEELGIGITYPKFLMKLPDRRSIEEEKEELYGRPMFPGEEFQDRLRKKYSRLQLSGNTIPAEKESFLQSGSYGCEGICDYFAADPYLDINGDLFLCCVNWLHSLGNLNRTTFEYIWNGELYRELRAMFFRGELPKYCKGCIFLRNRMFTPSIQIPGLDEGFWESEFDREVQRIIEEQLKNL